MTENKEFYHSKVKLFFANIFLLLFLVIFILMVYIIFLEGSIGYLVLGLFFVVLFSFFLISNILKLIRSYPYITITDEYIQLDSFTKSEVTIYLTDIKSIKVSQASFQNIIEIILYDEGGYYSQLSFHNKVRLFMNRVFSFSLFTIGVQAIRKKERPALLETLDVIMQHKVDNEAQIITARERTHNQDEETDFMEKYDPAPPINRSIDGQYFLKSYGYGLIIFILSFILFYLLISQDSNYLFYIIVSLVLYPLAKVLVDWLFGFKLTHKLDKQKGLTYYFYQLKFIFDLFLFHVSIFVAPFGFLFLLIRFIVIRMKR